MGEKQQHSSPWFWIFSGLSVAIYLLVMPAVLFGACSTSELVNQVIPGHFTISGQQDEKSTQTTEPRKTPNGAPLPPIIDGQGQVKQSAQGTYYPAREPERPWWMGFLCEINLSDYLIGFFTLILAISTIGLWTQTERLAKGADDQSDKMAESIS